MSATVKKELKIQQGHLEIPYMFFLLLVFFISGSVSQKPAVFADSVTPLSEWRGVLYAFAAAKGLVLCAAGSFSRFVLAIRKG